MEFLLGLSIMGLIILLSLLINQRLVRIHRLLTVIVPAFFSFIGLLMFMLVLIAPQMPYGIFVFIGSFAFFYGGILALIFSFVLKP